MSSNPPTSPPDRERSLSYISDVQRTPTGPRKAGPLAGSSGRDQQIQSCFGPYHTPTLEQRWSCSRAPSPTPTCSPRLTSTDPIGTWQDDDRGLGGDSDDDEDDVMKDESAALFTISHSEDDPIASNTTPAPSNEAQQKFVDLQSTIQSTTHKPLGMRASLPTFPRLRKERVVYSPRTLSLAPMSQLKFPSTQTTIQS